MSTHLADDASLAYHRFRQRARTLATISRSFETLTLGMSAAYLSALNAAVPEAWTKLVTRTASLVERAKALDGIVALDAREREALDFFAAIVRENADLLAGSHAFDPAGGERARFPAQTLMDSNRFAPVPS